MEGQSSWAAAQEESERTEGRCLAWASYKWRGKVFRGEHSDEQERGSARKKHCKEQWERREEAGLGPEEKCA